MLTGWGYFRIGFKPHSKSVPFLQKCMHKTSRNGKYYLKNDKSLLVHSFYYFYFYKLYFIDHVITVVPIFPLCPQHPTLPQAIPTLCLCTWVICKSFLATPFPILYFISPWLFCNYLFVLLNPLTTSPIPPQQLPIWQPSKHSLYPWFYLYSYLLNLWGWGLDLIVNRYVFLPFYCL